jgi:hypothetical protein
MSMIACCTGLGSKANVVPGGSHRGWPETVASRLSGRAEFEVISISS